MDDRLNRGILDHTLPFIKREGLAAITNAAQDKAQGRENIRIRLQHFYQNLDPLWAVSQSDRIDSATVALQSIYHRNIHPEMKIEWGSYPDHLGHRRGPGCFRCHNPNMKDDAGKAISSDCTSAIPSWRTKRLNLLNTSSPQTPQRLNRRYIVICRKNSLRPIEV